jgi:phage-related protein
VLEESSAVDQAVAIVGPQAEIARPTTVRPRRRWRVSFPMLVALDAATLMAFYDARHGPWEAFEWVNPNDALVYRVRFDETVAREDVLSGFVSSGGIRLVEVEG